MNLLGVGRVGRQVAGHPVVEPHAEGQQQIRLLDRCVDPGLAVHPHHPQVQGVAGRKAPQAEQCWGHRDICLFDELEQLFHGVGEQDPVSGEDERALGFGDQPRRALEFLGGRPQIRAVAGEPHRRSVQLKLDGFVLGVLGDIHQDRARPS